MISRKKKSQKGPSWLEVGMGAFLSVLLGTFLGAAYLISKPVTKVKEIPKDAPAGAVYFIEGARDFNRTVVVEEKRKQFDAGQSVALEEGELNILLGNNAPKPAEHAPAKPADKNAPAAEPNKLDMSALNARIHGGKIQFADTVTFNVYGITGSVIVQAVGVFRKDGPVFVFDPEVVLVGGCPLQRIPFAKDLVVKKLLFAQHAPDDIAAAWPKLADVTIDSSTLRLKMP